jgi:hypothetical protein
MPTSSDKLGIKRDRLVSLLKKKSIAQIVAFLSPPC